MRMYMAYDNFNGCCEGACLVFANTALEARKIASETIIDWFGGEWIDVRVRWLREHDYLKKLALSDKPHVIEDPELCQKCNSWGGGEISDGLCQECEELYL